jgi:hypothetical protein
MLIKIFWCCCFLLVPWFGWSQIDTTKDGTLLNSKISQQVIKNISKKPPKDSTKTRRSEDIFRPYEGKIIRNIYVRQIGFESNIDEDDKSIGSRVSRLANALHTDTRENVIREHLFIRKNKPLNPYRLADNERYLRDLNFIKDSKIYIRKINNDSDSVDIEVVTRDVFSLGATGRVSSLKKFWGGIYDVNVLGQGQTIQPNIGIDFDKTPKFGMDLLYRKSSVAGSLVNATVGYSQLNHGISIGKEYEYAYFLRLDRPLVSPYSRMAGGFEISSNWSKDVYNRDSTFLDYRYKIGDIWAGYNIGINNLKNSRNRHFVAIRYFNQHFTRQPIQEEIQKKPIYNSYQMALAEFTFYQKNYYTMRHIYGFGRTEDVPYGKTVTVTTGWMHEFKRSRMYTGASAVKSGVLSDGDFYNVEGGIGTFYHEKKSEDAFVYINAEYYTKLYERERCKIRHYARLGYARAFNNEIRELIALNRELRGFSPDSLYGTQRISLLQKSQENNIDINRNLYWGTSGGIRVRNENLIFGTVEFRTFFFPNPVQGVEPVSFRVSTNLQIKYSGTFIRPPSLVRYNN